jgi:hypothetical protein
VVGEHFGKRFWVGVTNTALCDQAGDKACGRDVEGWVAGSGAVRRNLDFRGFAAGEFALNMGDFAAVAFLDRDFC